MEGQMKRDMKLVEEIFLTIEAVPADTPISRKGIVVDGYNASSIERHVDMMVDAGYLVERTDLPPANPVDRGDIASITISWHGYDMLKSMVRFPRPRF
jgi:hypothetical protein